MSKRIEHVEEASRVLQLPTAMEDATEANALAYAQVHAALALVEQQRIANLIALNGLVAHIEMDFKEHGCRAHLTGEVGLYENTDNPNRAVLKTEIREALGL